MLNGQQNKERQNKNKLSYFYYSNEKEKKSKVIFVAFLLALNDFSV